MHMQLDQLGLTIPEIVEWKKPQISGAIFAVVIVLLGVLYSGVTIVWLVADIMILCTVLGGIYMRFQQGETPKMSPEDLTKTLIPAFDSAKARLVSFLLALMDIFACTDWRNTGPT